MAGTPDAGTEVTTETADLSPSQIASQGDSVQAYREAKALEKEHPELKRPFPTQDDAPVIEAKADELPANRKTRREREQDAQSDRTRKAVEQATADLRKELDALKAAPPRHEPARVEPARSVAPAEAVQEDYDRILASPDAPNLEKFKEAGKTYEQFMIATSLFVNRTLDAERTARQQQQDQFHSTVEREKSRAGKLKSAFDADPEVVQLFKTVQESKQWPENAIISRDVIGLQTFFQLEQDNDVRKSKGQALVPPSAYNAIAEEIASSEHPVALARHLSKPGELVRLAALPDGRSLAREIALIERDLTTPKPVKTRTQMDEPAITLTSSRATDPLDEETAAIRSGDQARYNELKREKRLRKAGLFK